MANSKIVPLDNVTDVDVVREWQEGDPKPYVLRGNVECEKLFETLDRLGVASFSCLCRTRYCESGDVFTTTPQFKRGVRITGRRLEEVGLATRCLSNCIQEAVFQAVEETPVNGYDFLIEATVIITDPHHSRGILAWVTAFVTCETDFEDREMWLL